jgi:hypothetical protein
MARIEKKTETRRIFLNMGKGPIAYIDEIEDGDYMLIVSANQQEHGGITGEGKARH